MKPIYALIWGIPDQEERKMKPINLKWNEIGDDIFISKKLFYRLLRLLKKENFVIEILSHSGTKPKI